MPSAENDPELQQQLGRGLLNGSLTAVEAAVGAGANVNGHPDDLFVPIVVAALTNHSGIVNFLLEQGADPNRPVTNEPPLRSSDTSSSSMLGERALQAAARSGNVEIARLLLRARANPNAADDKGRTPFFENCSCPDVCVEMFQLLLEAGADPALADKNGYTPLHAAAGSGNTVLVDMLYSRVPATLNSCTDQGRTPLFAACCGGHASMASKLLSLGAMQPGPPDENYMCPLGIAARDGFMDVVRVLLSDEGMRAIGGSKVLAQALAVAAGFRQARVLQLLLAVDGEEGRLKWANTNVDGRRVLHIGATYCCPAVVSVLLEAGVDETACDSEGRIPRDIIGVDLGRGVWPKMDRREEVAISRMLQRGPAYRARPWAWPSDEDADVGSSGDCHTAAAAAGGVAAAAVLSSPPAVKTPPIIGVRIFRPREKGSSKFFVRLVGRYCAKD